MFSSVMNKAFCFNKSKVLKCLYSHYVNQTKVINTSSKEQTFDSFVKNLCGNNVLNLKHNSLKNFQRLRENMIETGKYKNCTPKLSCDCKFTELKSILSMKFENWSSLSNSECLRKFRILSSYAVENDEDITSVKYKHLISQLTFKCSEFTDEEVLTLLKCLELWPNISEIRKLNIRNLFVEIDNELEKRSKMWSKDKILTFCDIICKLFSFRSNFVLISLEKLTTFSNLSSTDVVQIMSFLCVCPLPKAHASKLENYIIKYFDLFDISELAIISLGFFRSEIKFTNKDILHKLLKKLIKNADDFNDEHLGAFLKILRYNFLSKVVFIELYEQLFQILIPIVPRVHIFVLTHMSHLIAFTLIYNPVLVSAIIKRFLESLETVRIKDIERIIFFLISFNYSPNEPLYKIVINELRKPRRIEERRNFPKDYGYFLRHLALANIYPLDLIDNIMRLENKELAYGKNPYESKIDHFFLDQSMRIEVPDYKGPKLDNKLCEYFASKYILEDDHTYGSDIKQQVIKYINHIFKKENAACLYQILPHFTQNDIILCMDDDNNAISILTELNKIKTLIKWVPTELRKKYYFISLIVATETIIIRNTKQYSGNLTAKIRQLEKVGYIPIVIPYFEWITLVSYKMRMKYLENRILNCKRLKQMN